MNKDYTKNMREGIQFLTFPLFEREAWLVHGISTRFISKENERMDFNLGYTPFHDNAVVDTHRDLFLTAISAAGFQMLLMRQVHGDHVVQIHGGNVSSPDLISRDGSVTGKKGLFLPVVTADCAAVILADPVQRVVGAVHAGWRGALRSIVAKTARLLAEAGGADPSRLIAGIGPCLGPCCFEVGEDVAVPLRQAFPSFPDVLRERDGHKPVFDLSLLIYRQLRQSGLRHENISSVPLCTKCHQALFYSYRGEGKGTGRILAGIGIR